MLKYLLLPLLLVIFETHAQNTEQKSNAHPFIIYGYIPWKMAKSDQQILANNLKPIKVIYEDGYSNHKNVDRAKLKKIAEETFAHPDIPISFDIELGNRFKPETVLPKVQSILAVYRSYHPKALVGVYALLPQNTYAWKTNINSFDHLNEQYKPLLNFVDFLSPSLYNYNGTDFEAWSKSARYNMKQAKNYAFGKPIIPYISPVYRLGPYKAVKKGTVVQELDEEAMKKRLQLLYDLGASGCIIWASSQDRKQDGQMPEFSPDKAWGKAVIDFVKKHSQDL